MPNTPHVVVLRTAEGLADEVKYVLGPFLTKGEAERWTAQQNERLECQGLTAEVVLISRFQDWEEDMDEQDRLEEERGD